AMGGASSARRRADVEITVVIVNAATRNQPVVCCEIPIEAARYRPVFVHGNLGIDADLMQGLRIAKLRRRLGITVIKGAGPAILTILPAQPGPSDLEATGIDLHLATERHGIHEPAIGTQNGVRIIRLK